MIAEVEALRAEIAAQTPYAVHAFAAPSLSLPQVVIEAPPTGDRGELSACGTTSAVDDTVRVKAVAGTSEGVAMMLARIGEVLSPGREVRRLPMPGRALDVVWVRSEFVAADTSVTIPSTNRHPAVGVDSYRVVSQPI